MNSWVYKLCCKCVIFCYEINWCAKVLSPPSFLYIVLPRRHMSFKVWRIIPERNNRKLPQSSDCERINLVTHSFLANYTCINSFCLVYNISTCLRNMKKWGAARHVHSSPHCLPLVHRSKNLHNPPNCLWLDGLLQTNQKQTKGQEILYSNI